MAQLHRRLLLGLIGPACWLAAAPLATAADSPPPVDIAEKPAPTLRPVLTDDERIAILHDLRSLATTGTLLHIAAHPDDENTNLIAWASRGRGYRAAYLSLTRGDGGQNELGPEFGEKLGVARTQELLAARRIDGGRQFFTRAIDFGYSKTPEETLAFWNRGKVLGDVVRVIRKFRPDVIVTRFPIPPGSGGHGQHTASGILAVEAFKIAGDPAAYPEQIEEGLAPWQPKRVLWNSWRDPRGAGLDGPIIAVDIGGDDPVTGESFASIANESRAMHKTQGLGGFAGRGGGGPNVQSFMLLAGEPAESDLMDGVDTTWARFPGGAEIGAMIAKANEDFDAMNPDASLPALFAIRRKLAALNGSDPVVSDRLAIVERVIMACLGWKIEVAADRAEVVPGERIELAIHSTNRARVPGWLVERRFLVNGHATHDPDVLGLAPDADLVPVSETFERSEIVIPIQTPLTQPYWLREEGFEGVAEVSDLALIGAPENPPPVVVENIYKIDGLPFVVTSSPASLAIVPPVSMKFDSDVFVLQPGRARRVGFELDAVRAGVSGTVRLDVPLGWSASPASREFRIDVPGNPAHLEFEVTPPASGSMGRISAVATVGGRDYSSQREEIRYAHLPPQLLQPPATARLSSFEFAVAAKKVGYLPGAGDDVANCLRQMGVDVRELTGANLTPEGLAGLDAVVLGVRAFEDRDDLAANMPGLLAWAEQGGTVVVQYNRANRLKSDRLGPYSLSIQGNASSLRVTDETAPVRFLAPDHPVLNSPNKIGAADFEGWVQERGTYFPSKWDEAAYTTILAMSDPGETQPDSSILVARHGKGHYVYTGLAFFRQLPAGVPGAYRLFANLISLGK